VLFLVSPANDLDRFVDEFGTKELQTGESYPIMQKTAGITALLPSGLYLSPGMTLVSKT
jgi:hypothetical protein